MNTSKTLEGFAPPPADAPAPVQPAEPARQPGTIYTFYSFKGGVGRSMAMANIACLLAREGKKVLVVDWDLEAPGLEHFFLPHDTALAEHLASTRGVIDLLGEERPDWHDCVAPIRMRDIEIDIIHSGKASRDDRTYTDQVQHLNWVDLYTNEKTRIGNYFDRVRAEWQDEYDFILLDSRTGVTDISDLCTVILPDRLVMLFVTNEQNVAGISDIYARAMQGHERLASRDPTRSRLTVLPVLSRDEFNSEYERSAEWRERAAERLAPLLADWLPREVAPLDVFQKVFIPYQAIWSFGETLPVVQSERDIANPASISAAYGRIARLLAHDMDWSCLDGVADPGDLANKRADLRAEQERIDAELARRTEELAAKSEAATRRTRTISFGLVGALMTIIGIFAYDAVQKINAQRAADRDRYEEQLTRLEKSVAEQADLKKSLSEAQQAQKQAQDQVIALTARLDKAETDLKLAELQANQNENSTTLARQERDALKAEVDRLKAELTAAETLLSHTESALSEARADEARLSKSCAVTESRLMTELAGLRTQLDEARKKEREITATMNDRIKSAAVLETRLSECRGTINQYQKAWDSIRPGDPLRPRLTP